MPFPHFALLNAGYEVRSVGGVMRGVVGPYAAMVAAALFALNCVDVAHARWLDGRTGNNLGPRPPIGFRLDPGTRDSAHNSRTGENVYWDERCGTWRDGSSGDEVWRPPIGFRLDPGTRDSAHNSRTGENIYWEPCPPPGAALIPGTDAARRQVGFYFGGQLLWNAGRVRANEYLAATGALTNSFLDTGDALGAGLVAGWNAAPWGNNIVVGGFASLDFLNQTINRTFAGGSFLGTTTHWIGTAGVKAGAVTSPGLFIYGLGGASVLNADLTINFGGPDTSQNTTVWGGTLGVGAAVQPAMLQNYGRPVSLFVEYRHTWWDTARLHMPAASPAFNYAFRRADDTLRFGFTVHSGAANAGRTTDYSVLIEQGLVARR